MAKRSDPVCQFCASKPTHYVKLLSSDMRTPTMQRKLCWWCTETLEAMFPAQVYVTNMVSTGARRRSRKLLKQLRRDLQSARESAMADVGGA